MKTASNSRVLRTIPLLITSARRMGCSPCGHSLRGYVTAVIVSMTILSSAHAQYGGGTGETNDPYQIATAEDLMLLGESPDDYDKHFILTADIDLDPNLPGRKVFDRALIAPDVNDNEEWLQGTAFTGVFDGNGHTISHLTIEAHI